MLGSCLSPTPTWAPMRGKQLLARKLHAEQVRDGAWAFHRVTSGAVTKGASDWYK